MLADRINQFMKHVKSPSIRSFEKETGLPRGSIGRATDGSEVFSYKNTKILLNFWPDLNANWLFREEETQMILVKDNEGAQMTTPARDKKLQDLIKDNERYKNIIDRYLLN